MSDIVSHDLARLAAHAMDLLSVDQLVRVLDGLNLIDLTAKAMSPMRLSQLMELAARCSYDLLKEKRVRLTIGTDKIEQGQLDYDLVGKNPADLDTLKLIASEMAEKDELSIDNKELFHMVSAVITAAQMLANDLDEGKAKPILAKGENLANLTLGTEDRAEKTKEFLDELFALLAKLV
jgi:hypothetical protein